MKLSRHAINRVQQRGLRSALVNFIIENGTWSRKPGNALEYTLSNQQALHLIEEKKHEIDLIQKARGRSVIVDGKDSLVITVI